MDGSVIDADRGPANADDWHSVTDAKKRKQIQDRLAQRARRKRLREAKKSAKQSGQTDREPRSPKTQIDEEDQDQVQCSLSVDEASGIEGFDDRDMIAWPGNVSNPCLLTFNIASIGQAPTLSYELPYSPTVMTALYINGQVLGLMCMGTVRTVSLPASPSVPLPLHPTQAQLVTPHMPAIDRFPFPGFRDNVITLSNFFDEQGFIHDLFTMPSFSITPGGATWDPHAWKIEKPFADKWGFLFY